MIEKSLKQVWVAAPLLEVFENIRKNVAADMRKKYNLKDVIVHRSISSQILAAQQLGKKTLNFRIKKLSSTRGVIELF